MFVGMVRSLPKSGAPEIEQDTYKIVNNLKQLNTNIYSSLQTSGSQSSNLYCSFSTPVLIDICGNLGQLFSSIVLFYYCRKPTLQTVH